MRETKVARKAVNKSIGRNKKNFKISRIINVPKICGFLPIVPILTALSALCSLASGSAVIAKTVNNASMGKKQFEESKRHNKKMESIKVGEKFRNFEFCSKVHSTFPRCVYERLITKISLERKVRKYKPG